MQFNTLGEGVLLGFLAMVGVFLVLALIGVILFLFRIIFYREETQIQRISVVEEEIGGISKKKIAAISAALYQYLNGTNKQKTTKRSFPKNKTYEKLKIKRWKNG